MNLKDFTSGLAIITKYYDNPDGYHIGADNDVIYIYPSDNPMSSGDVATLRTLGFYQDGDNGENTGYKSWESWRANV
jgi:hypothetical protein